MRLRTQPPLLNHLLYHSGPPVDRLEDRVELAARNLQLGSRCGGVFKRPDRNHECNYEGNIPPAQ